MKQILRMEKRDPARFFDARECGKDPRDEADPKVDLEDRLSWGDCVPFV